MTPPKVIVAVCAIDQGDILEDFVDWHLHLGVDLIVIQDFQSKDGSPALLDRLAKTGRLTWFTLPERDMTKYQPADALAEIARDKYQADWIILCDADEFLCPLGADLKTILRDAEAEGYSVLNVDRLNMTGPEPEQAGKRATLALNMRVDRPAVATSEQTLSGDLPAPQSFTRVAPRTIVRAEWFKTYGAGAHSVSVTGGKAGHTDRLRYLHYNMRRYDVFETKVRNAAKWLEDNSHLDPNWGWHWRRWIRLHGEGRLREDYAAQFVTPPQARELIHDGVCSIDDTVADWLKDRPRTWWQRLRARSGL